MLALTVTHIVGLRTASPHFIVLTIPLLYYLRMLVRRGYGFWLGVILVALLVLPWLHFLWTIGDGKFEHPSVFVPLPLLTLAVLLMNKQGEHRDAEITEKS
jgi:hypothetical protein